MFGWKLGVVGFIFPKVSHMWQALVPLLVLEMVWLLEIQANLGWQQQWLGRSFGRSGSECFQHFLKRSYIPNQLPNHIPNSQNSISQTPNSLVLLPMLQNMNFLVYATRLWGIAAAVLGWCWPTTSSRGSGHRQLQRCADVS